MTLIQMLWEDLDRMMDQLMSGQDELNVDDEGWARLQGRAEGVAWSLAVITQAPKKPNINTVKAEAMERWESRQEDE